MNVGDICEGVVTRIEAFGMFVDVKGVPGLIRIPELSWDRIRHPAEVAEIGDSVRFQILNLNDPNDRPHEHFNGSMKVLIPRPSPMFFRFTLQGMLLGVSVVCVVLVILNYVVIGPLRVVQVGIPNAYAAWDVGEVVVYHMETHDDTWPEDWNDLESTFNSYVSAGRMIRGGMTFAELKRLVDIDFTFMPRDVSEELSESSPLRVIWLRDGRDDCWEGAEPNEMVLRYLGHQDPL